MSTAGAGPARSEAASPAPDEDLADRVARAVLSVPGVSRLAEGSGVATLLPGRRVEGVRLQDAGAQVHVVLGWGGVIDDVADQVRDAVRSLTGGQVAVVVEDMDEPS